MVFSTSGRRAPLRVYPPAATHTSKEASLISLFTTKLFLGLAVFFWLLLCTTIYRKFRGAAWLAASTAASCLFFLGTTIVASLLVRGALFLLPLWIGVAALIAAHLLSAQKKSAETLAPSMQTNVLPEDREPAADIAGLSAQTDSEMYI